MTSAHPERRQKIKHELKEMLAIFLYLAFFFCALETLETFLLDEYHLRYWGYTFALISALVITKVIMIGEYAKLGKRHEDKALFLSAIWKAFVFGLLVFAFHIVEEVIKRLIHGADSATVSRELRLDQFAGRAIVVFCTFIPLFAFREFRRVMGEEEFRSLVFGRATDQKYAIRIGGTFAWRYNKHQSLKFNYSAGTYSRFGGNYQNVAVAWQYSWIGWPKKK
jgi:hypothetical protein